MAKLVYVNVFPEAFMASIAQVALTVYVFELFKPKWLS